MMSPRCNTCGAYFTGSESVCAHCGVPRTAMAQANTGYGPMNQPQFAQPAMGQQCSTCGRYFTGNEAACLSCNTPRNYAAPMGGNQWQQNQVGDAVLMGASVGWTQRYFSPERIIMRRVIGCGITLFIFAACFGVILFTGLASALFH